MELGHMQDQFGDDLGKNQALQSDHAPPLLWYCDVATPSTQEQPLHRFLGDAPMPDR
jgi:hypothetical protein